MMSVDSKTPKNDQVESALVQGSGDSEASSDVKCLCARQECSGSYRPAVGKNRSVVEPFCWRVCPRQDGTWIHLDEQSEIENAFCDPDCLQFDTIGPRKCNKITINFETMACELGAIQRVSTPSYVKCHEKTDATHWLWYWKDGHSNNRQWKLYEVNKPPYQDVLESKYLHDKTHACWFETANLQQYIIDFSHMKQINLTTDAKRDVRRRPAAKSDADAGILQNYRFHFDPSKLPISARWNPMNTDTESYIDLIPVKDRGTWKHLHSSVEIKFFKSMCKQKYSIERVFFIQNLRLWKNYQDVGTWNDSIVGMSGSGKIGSAPSYGITIEGLTMRTRKKRSMEKTHGELGQFERQLFHGTEELSVRCICHQNFDPRMHGVHGTRFGKGAYFATTAKYSHQFTSPLVVVAGKRMMFVSRVLIGKSTLGFPDYQRPPPLDRTRPHGALYDTCVDDVLNPSIYVVFDNVQCYPEFLIVYKDQRAANPPPPTRTNLQSSTVGSQLQGKTVVQTLPPSTTTQYVSVNGVPVDVVITSSVTITAHFPSPATAPATAPVAVPPAQGAPQANVHSGQTTTANAAKSAANAPPPPAANAATTPSARASASKVCIVM